MATSTEVAIATTTLGSAASSITFNSISSAYTDLRLVVTHTGTSGYVSLIMTFNSDTGTNYSNTYLRGNGSAASSGRNTSQSNIWLNYDGAYTIPNFHSVDIFSYGGSTYKTCLITGAEDRNGAGNAYNQVGLWRSTSAINTITLTADSGTYAIGTTATLYGIL